MISNSERSFWSYLLNPPYFSVSHSHVVDTTFKSEFLRTLPSSNYLFVPMWMCQKDDVPSSVQTNVYQYLSVLIHPIGRSSM